MKDLIKSKTSTFLYSKNKNSFSDKFFFKTYQRKGCLTQTEVINLISIGLLSITKLNLFRMNFRWLLFEYRSVLKTKHSIPSLFITSLTFAACLSQLALMIKIIN